MNSASRLAPDQPLASTYPDFISQCADRGAYGSACYYLSPQGEWRALSWPDYLSCLRRAASLLQAHGLGKGDRIGIMLPTGIDWEYAEKGALWLGAVVVGIEPHAPVAHLEYVIREAEVSLLVAVDSERLREIDPELLASLKGLLLIETDDSRWPNASNWDDLHRQAEITSTAPLEPADPATIIFTSGTSGQPKGVMFTHRQCLIACESLLQSFPEFGQGDHLICWMPLANLFQRIMNLCALGAGARVYFVADPLSVTEHLGSVQPSLFVGVPRFYEKLHQGILARIDGMPAWQRRTVHGALAIAQRHAQQRREASPVSALLNIRHSLADRLVLGRLRAVLGGKMQCLISGSAPCPRPVLEFFDAIGVPILEAYGTSENIVPVATNTLQQYRLGSVGKPMPGNEVKLAADGEVMVRGEGLFAGYLGSESAVVSDDGFYQTGDLGRFDEDGYLYLTGRKSEVVKSSTGRKVALNKIEMALRQAPSIDQAVVIGAGRKVPVAIITLDPLLASPEGAASPSDGGAGADTTVDEAQLAREIVEVTEILPAHEQVAGCIVSSRPFSLDRGEVTPNLKLRRDSIASAFDEEINALDATVDSSRGKSAKNTDEGPVILWLDE